MLSACPFGDAAGSGKRAQPEAKVRRTTDAQPRTIPSFMMTTSQG
jgi:hypothetical protein